MGYGEGYVILPTRAGVWWCPSQNFFDFFYIKMVCILGSNYSYCYSLKFFEGGGLGGGHGPSSLTVATPLSEPIRTVLMSLQSRP